MAQVTFSFEGGVSGNTVAAGAGAAPGDTNFDAVTNAGATDTYDNAHAAHGGLSNQIATTTSASCFNAWTTSIGTQATVWVRAYLFFTAAPTVQHRVINFVGAAASRGNILATTGGAFIFTNAAGGTVLTSAAFPLNAWFRLEAMFTGSATVGQWEYKIWNTPDSPGTPSDTQTSAANLATGGTCDTYRFGFGTAVASAGPFWLDDIGVSTTAYLGPVITAGPAPLSFRPGKTWLRRFRHQQQLPLPPPAGAVTQFGDGTVIAGAAAVAALVTEIPFAAAAGAGTVTAAVTQTATASLAGAGAVTAKATQIAPATLAGAGAVTGVVTQIITAALTGVSAVTANATVIAGAAIAGAGSVTAVVTEAVIAAPAGAGALNATAAGAASTATITAAGTVTDVVTQAVIAAPVTVGAVTAKATQAITAAPAGAGALAALAVQTATAALAAAGSVNATGGLQVPFTIGALTAGDQATSAQAPATAAAALTARESTGGGGYPGTYQNVYGTEPGGNLTAGDQRTGGPG